MTDDSTNRPLWRTPRGTALLGVLGGTLLRLIGGAMMGLGLDESYHLANTRALQLSYFDHPPITFWIASLVTAIDADPHPVLLRLPFVLIFLGTCLLLWSLTRRLFGDWSAAWAVVLFNVSPLFSIVAGSWVMPDGVMLFGALASAWLALPLLIEGERSAGRGEIWARCLSAGAMLGVAMLSKYLAVLYAFGVFIYVVTTPGRRRWLAHPAVYAGGLVSIAVFSPVLIWNAQHDWVSFTFQGGRAAGVELRPGQMAAMIGGQALYLAPWVWWPLLVEGVKAVRAGRVAERTWLCACLGLPAIVIMSIVPLWGKDGLPHWTAIGYVFLFPLLGLATSSQIDGEQRRLIRGWLRFSIVSFPIVVALLIGHAATGWIAPLLPERAREKDPTLETLSWGRAASLIEDRPGIERDVVIGTLRWTDGAKAGAALGHRWPVAVFSDNPHNFPFQHAGEDFVGRPIVFVGTPERLERLESRMGDLVSGFQDLGTVTIERAFGSGLTLRAVRSERLLEAFAWPYPSGRTEDAGGGDRMEVDDER